MAAEWIASKPGVSSPLARGTHHERKQWLRAILRTIPLPLGARGGAVG